MQHEDVDADITVVGGGLAGVCAAIAAARAGAKVALIQNRSVLGGNSSSEIRVWVCGATAHGQQSMARETGIMGELFVENQFTNPDGNPYYWDLVLLEAVRAEPKIQLFLDTDVRSVEADGAEDRRTVRAVTGWMMGSERVITFHSPTFIDCSGDGIVGFLAGAKYRQGREPRAEFEEPWAPEIPDERTLGSTILFYTKDAGHPVPYVPPTFALDISTTSIPQHRPITVEANGCAYWWIEWGGDLDVVTDNDRIRTELQAAVYGIWDWIKNSGQFQADNLTLEWIGSIPGKREYRRFIGDVTLTQHDVLAMRDWPDAIGFGGWSIDLHPPGGMYTTEHGSRHWYSDGPYPIPLRSLYSANVQNLWFAGRTISASHVAFGSTRVMATCALTGEGAGLGAALAQRLGITPRELATKYTKELRHTLTRADSSVIGVVDDDPANLALTARAAASSTLTNVAVEDSVTALRLDHALGIVLPVADEFHGLELLVSGTGQLRVSVNETNAGQVYLPARQVAESTVAVHGERVWARLPVEHTVDEPRNLFLVVDPEPGIQVHLSDHPEPGMLLFTRRDEKPARDDSEHYRPWKPYDVGVTACVRMEETTVYQPRNVIGGYSRPFAGPNMWVSSPLDEDPQPWVEVRWTDPVEIRTVEVLLDASIEIDLINLHHHFTPQRIMPGLVTAYQLLAETDHGWDKIGEVEGNRRRLRTHALDQPLTVAAVRLVVTETSCPRARVVNIRVR